MGAFFDFSLLDVWNNPVTKVLRWGTKTAVKGIASANAKEEMETAGTSEFEELLNEAKNGDSDAQLALAIYYAEEKNAEKFVYWLDKSAEQGNEQALELLELVGG